VIEVVSCLYEFAIGGYGRPLVLTYVTVTFRTVTLTFGTQKWSRLIR